MSTRRIGLILGPVLFVVFLLWVHPQGMSEPARAVLASTLWVATWWITEAIPIPVTSLLPIVLFPLTGALPIQRTTEAFGHPLIFLYVGGFIIAVAIERWNLHRRIAMNIIYWVGTNTRMIVLGFMLATALLSMWISNTATAVMMLPIGMAVVSHLGGAAAGQRENFGKILMLAIAYSASIGGVATLIGTPTNLVLAGVIQELYDKEISFMEWFMFGLPISAILLAICWLYLTRVAGKMSASGIPGGRAEIRRQLEQLGKLSYEEKLVGIVFATTGLCWILRSFVLNHWLPGLNDTIIAIAGASILFFLPSKQEGKMLLDWEAAVRIPWGIILLFGGGLALAAGFQDTGLAEWIGSQLTLLQGVHLLLLMLVLIAAVNFLTEITSNVATASMILPILASLAFAINVHPYGLMVAATVAASCAFMLPVATPPNAVVFGSGYLRIPDMVRTGIWMNLISILLLTLAVYLLLPEIWQISLHHAPEHLAPG
ncbi:MAG: SLC13 family permease [Saprospiraceae bacterium]|nr:SLC13 family permease [Saprospiraceae bacterium]